MQVRQTSAPVDGPWNPVTPVISSTVALTTSSALATQRGNRVRLVITFVEENSDGVRSVADVTGFVVSDVEVIATAVDISGTTQVLPTSMGLDAVGNIAYEFTLQPDMASWPSAQLAACTEVTLALNIPGELILGSLVCSLQNDSTLLVHFFCTYSSRTSSFISGSCSLPDGWHSV